MTLLDAHRPANYSLQQWRQEMLSDELLFLQFRSDTSRRRRVYRCPGERFTDVCEEKFEGKNRLFVCSEHCTFFLWE